MQLINIRYFNSSPENTIKQIMNTISLYICMNSIDYIHSKGANAFIIENKTNVRNIMVMSNTFV